MISIQSIKSFLERGNQLGPRHLAQPPAHPGYAEVYKACHSELCLIATTSPPQKTRAKSYDELLGEFQFINLSSIYRAHIEILDGISSMGYSAASVTLSPGNAGARLSMAKQAVRKEAARAGVYLCQNGHGRAFSSRLLESRRQLGPECPQGNPQMATQLQLGFQCRIISILPGYGVL